MTSHEDWLRGLDETQLTRLLENRPDAAPHPPPRTYAALAHLLGTPRSVAAAMLGLDRSALTVLAALTGERSRLGLGILLDQGGVNSAADIDDALEALAGYGLVWPSDGGYALLPLHAHSVEFMGPSRLAAPAVAASRGVDASGQQIAVARFGETVDAVLKAVDSGSIATMKAGGIGISAIRALSKSIDAEHDSVVELILDLAGRMGLVAAAADGVRATTDLSRWMSTDRAHKSATMIAAWWCADSPPTNRPSAKGKYVPVLGVSYPQPSTVRLRHRMQVVAPEQGFDDAAAACRYFEWAIPGLVDAALPGDTAALWREATWLGVVAGDRPTELSRALGTLGAADVGVVAAAVEPIAQKIVAGSESTLRLLPDLTAVVTGPASEEVSALLVSSAIGQTKGSASTWRFTPESIRGYLDGGGTADELLASLRANAVTEVPQALEYLIGDRARTHGNITVLAMSSCLVSEDESLISEIAARNLLGGTRVAPTVYLSSVTAPDAIEQLRAAGYSPVPSGDSGRVTVTRAETPRTPATSPLTVPTANTPGAVAAALASGSMVPVDVDRVASSIRAWCALSPRDTGVLARAVAQGTEIAVDFTDPTRGIVRGVFGDLVLDSGVLHGWSERSGDRASIQLVRIRMVTAA
nr:helicase-associated domain-containing protein [Rhodococcus sp. (in: high G+C Gram-positive bacteria)]